jgi:hypothetical protein
MRGARATRRILLTVVVGALTATPAKAGTYWVSGACGDWAPFNASPAHVAVYGACPGMVARNVGGSSAASWLANGRWVINAPAGAHIAAVTMRGELFARNGWVTTAFTTGGGTPGPFHIFEECPGAMCPGGRDPLGGTYPLPNVQQAIVRVMCGAASCPMNDLHGQVGLTGTDVLINDWSEPQVSITGASLTQARWLRGTESVELSAVGRLWDQGDPRQYRQHPAS